MKITDIIRKLFDLQLFADGGEGGGDGTGTAGTDGAATAAEATKGQKAGAKATGPADLSGIRYGKPEEAAEAQEAKQEAKQEEQPKPQQPQQRASFDQLVRDNPDYQRELQKRIDQAINKRFAKAKAAEEQSGKLAPALNLLAAKYGVAAGDTDALIEAINGDSELIEQQAMDAGMEPDAFREYSRLKAENEAFKKAEAERERQAQMESAYQQWQQQAETARRFFPGLDLRTEVRNPQFAELLGAGIDVLTAYRVVHQDEIDQGLIQRAAADAKRQTVASIQQKQGRPKENATGRTGAATVRADISKLTTQDFDEIMRRAQRGERIRF